MTDTPRSTVSAVVALHVHWLGWDRADSESRQRLQTAAHQSLQRLRHRLIHHPTTRIASELADELARVTGGHLAEEDLPMAAAAIHRGGHLAVTLIDQATPCPTLQRRSEHHRPSGRGRSGSPAVFA